MTKKELALKTVAELRELAAGYGHKLAATLKSGIVDELADVMKKTRKTLKKTSRETAKTVRAVKKAVAAGKKAAAKASAAGKKKKAAPAKKTAKAKSSAISAKAPAKVSSRAATLELKKKDLQGMTVTALKETASKFGLKQNYPNKDEFVTALAKDLAKLRAEAKKKAVKPVTKTTTKTADKTAAKALAKPVSKPAKKKPAVKPAAKTTAGTAAEPAAKKAAAPKKAPAAKAKSRPSKPKASKTEKPSTSFKERVTKAVGPAVHAMAEKARELVTQVKGKIPSIKSARPKVAKKLPEPVSGKLPTRDISMPRVASVLPGERETQSPVELLAAIAVEPTELFVSWVLALGRKPSGPVVLRVQEEGGEYFDVTVGSLSGSAYIRVHPGRHYRVDAGMMDAQGVFAAIRSSNPVVTPPGDVQRLGEHGEGDEQGLPDGFYLFKPQEYGPK